MSSAALYYSSRACNASKDALHSLRTLRRRAWGKEHNDDTDAGGPRIFHKRTNWQTNLHNLSKTLRLMALTHVLVPESGGFCLVQAAGLLFSEFGQILLYAAQALSCKCPDGKEKLYSVAEKQNAF
jgi:hypothetical protein